MFIFCFFLSVDEDGNFFKVSDGAFSWSLYPEEYMYDSRREKFLPVRWMAPESLTAGFYDAASDVVITFSRFMNLSSYIFAGFTNQKRLSCE